MFDQLLAFELFSFVRKLLLLRYLLLDRTLSVTEGRLVTAAGSQTRLSLG